MDASKLVSEGEDALTVIVPLGMLHEVGLTLVTLETVNGGRTL